jgi:hypothetical protein
MFYDGDMNANLNKDQVTEGAKRRCTATRANGKACRGWAQWDSDPPRCAAHRTGACGAVRTGPRAPAPIDREPADSEPISIGSVIEDLGRKQLALSKYIDSYIDQVTGQKPAEEDDKEAAPVGPDLGAIAHLFALHGLNASRLGRLLRDQRALSGAASDGITGAIAQALDELSTELGAAL